MEKLKEHIEWCLRWCQRDNKELWLHQAFGAVQFYICYVGDKGNFAEIEKMWNEYKARFEVCLYGQRLSL